MKQDYSQIFLDIDVPLDTMPTDEFVKGEEELAFEESMRRNEIFKFATEKEAQEVEKIIYTFKKHMHPAYANEIMGVKLSQGRILKIPDTFDIQYMFTGNKNEFLNRYQRVI